MLLKKMVLSLAAVALMAGVASAQITPIDDIQLYDSTGAPNSLFNGQTVTVRGVITVEKGTYNSGTHYIQDATGGLTFFDSSAPALAIGDEVEVTGTMGTFQGEISMNASSYNFIGSPGPVSPLVLTVNEALDNDGSGTLTFQDYEIVGTLVQVTGTIVRPVGTGTFGLRNDTGDTLAVFIDGDTGIDDTSVNDGDVYQITSPMVNFNGVLELKPRFQGDLVENPGNPFPTVQNITPSPWTPEVGESVVLSADISDNGSVVRADLFYRDRGGVSFTQVAMTPVVGTAYEATIAGTSAAGVEYYLEVEDDAGQVTVVPGDAPASTLGYAVGTTSIVDIQSDFDPATGSSNRAGELVNIEALVTVAPGEIQVGIFSNYVVGEASGGKWSGVFIFEGSGGNTFLRGDKIRISGQVGEFSGITEVIPQNADSIELVSFGSELPPIPIVSTTELDTTEAWESVVVATPRAAVADTIFGGDDWLLQDAGSDSTVYVDPAPGVSIIATLGEEQYVTGFLDTRFGRNELVPRDDSDIVLANAVGNESAPVAKGAVFRGIVPNPFNPSTEISFTTPREGLTELAIFDTRGRRVRTLVNGRVAGGDHAEVWDGKDNTGAFVGSGVYYARLRFEAESISLEKLTLVK